MPFNIQYRYWILVLAFGFRRWRFGDSFLDCAFHTYPLGAVEKAPPGSLQRPYPTDKNQLPQLNVKCASKKQKELVDGRWGSE
jgi:hypothetical protein